jgi:hypothetical protein
MKEIIDEITKLTDEWYVMIGKDHHKDRDCHWYIETKWSYGYSPIYVVAHYGYILDTINDEFTSYEDALKRLKDILVKEIEEYRSQYKGDDFDW